jgi:hypothetical protein
MNDFNYQHNAYNETVHEIVNFDIFGRKKNLYAE